ncbi:MAG: crosslink repair DNA glycosylase YcaQ family protein [Anaerolineaceae bacterium]|nr:crosslink repair DNA glycosylase YcaQ family protein [Anaerolineaceae bacterium]
MPILNSQRLQEYRAETFRTAPGRRVYSRQEAIDYVNQRGFIFFWPIKDVTMPSLWAAAAGDRPVADEHDDPGHITWDWKDSLLGARRWYYGRILRRRNTILSLATAPYFYALTPNYGDPQSDYLQQYEDGQLTNEAKAVYEVLLNEGPQDTLELRRKSHLGNSSRFNKALDDLQIEMKATPVGISPVGAFRYAFIYDLVHRHLPEIPEQARLIDETAARVELLKHFFQSVGYATLQDVRRLFAWPPEPAQTALVGLVSAGFLLDGVELQDQAAGGFALASFFDVDSR